MESAQDAINTIDLLLELHKKNYLKIQEIKSAKKTAGTVAGEAVKLSQEAGDRAKRVADGTKRTAEGFAKDAKQKLK